MRIADKKMPTPIGLAKTAIRYRVKAIPLVVAPQQSYHPLRLTNKDN
jgi:hypothetical protein